MTSLQRVVILGSGTSTGVPVIGCTCSVCMSPDPKDNRTRASIALQLDDERWLVVDTSPEFRIQALRAGIANLECVLYTHTHADHCHGFDDLRAYSFYRSEPIQAFLMPEYVEEFRTRFSYAFTDTGYKGAKPLIILNNIPEQRFQVCGLAIEPIRLQHGVFGTCGFKIGDFAYFTDFKGLPDGLAHRWRGQISTMIASGIHYGSHHAHNTIPETLEMFADLEVDRGIITHLSHKVSHQLHSPTLPPGVELAYDGMIIDL